MIGRINFTKCENFERFHRRRVDKIKGEAKLSLVSPPFVKPSLNNENYFDNIFSDLENAFSDLEKRKKNFF